MKQETYRLSPKAYGIDWLRIIRWLVLAAVAVSVVVRMYGGAP